MTKTEIAQFVGDKLHMTDADSLALLKSFVDRRYEMIWNSGVWRETQGTTSYSVAADTTDVTLDGTVDFPIAAAWDDNEIAPMDYGTVFQLDPDLFNESGTPTNYLVLPKDSSGNNVIRLLRKPDTAKTLLVLGKLKVTALGDNDSPKINGIDNALIAYVEADFLESSGQYGKAQVKLQEATGQMQLMRDLESGQSAKISRLVPEMAPVWDVNDFD
tara:strand:- start:812 stop:1459 length:648 start_codon:yes stop_codon:yes gene_type:complete